MVVSVEKDLMVPHSKQLLGKVSASEPKFPEDSNSNLSLEDKCFGPRLNNAEL